MSDTVTAVVETEAQRWINYFIGRREEEVRDWVLAPPDDYQWRVVKRDGVPTVGTRDHKPYRVNAVIENGIVREVYLG